jgi:hypothetical protein
MTGSGSVRRRQWLAARAAAAAVRAPAAAAAALALAVLGTAPAMAATAARGQAPASAATAPATVKYYIVPRPAHGAVPTLYSIAAATLGNGSLYMEIFKLNKGRLQPNGQRLENPHAVEPGWVLLLPPDVSGPGVHSGPLPAAARATSRGSRRTSPRRPARAAASPAAAAAGYGSGTIVEPVIGGALLVFAVAGLGLVVRRRRRAGGNQRKPTLDRAAGPGSDWVRGLAADISGGTAGPGGAAAGAGGPGSPYPDPTNWPAAGPGVAASPSGGAPGAGGQGSPSGVPSSWPPSAHAYQGRPAGGDGPDWAYPDHPAWPAGSQGRPLTPDHPSWPATDLGRPVGAAADYGRPTGADRPGWPYPDHPSWPASDLGRPLADDDYPSWPASGPGGGWAGPDGPPPGGGAGLPQRERLGTAPAPAVHHDPNPGQPVPQVPPARGRHVRVPAGYSSHPGPADDTPQRWSAQLARSTGLIPQTYYDLAFGDGRLQVMLTETPGAGQDWATGPSSANVLQLTSADTGRQGAVTWQPGPPGNTDPVRMAQRILADADQQAAAIRLEAAAEAAAVREAAEREAAQIRLYTAAEAAPIRQGAEREAAEIRQLAAAQAAAVREAAEQEADAIRGAAQREADTLRSAVKAISADLTAYITEKLPGPIERVAGGAGPAEGYPAPAEGYARPASSPEKDRPGSGTWATAPHEAPARREEADHYEKAAPGGPATGSAMSATTPVRPGTRPRPARPATRPARRTEKPARSRQGHTARLFAGTIAALVVLALGTGAYQLATRGFTFFVFRSAGTGATDNSAIFPGIIPTPKPSPSPHPTAGTGQHGARGAHHRRRHHHHA